MQDDQFKPNPSGTLYVPETTSESAPQGSASQDDGSWAAIGHQIERQLRRDVARLVGATESDDWNAIKEALANRVKGQTESIDRGDVTRRIQEIGSQVEERVREGLSGATQAGRYADWGMIGRTLRERVEQVLDPAKGPFPGGSGTGSSEEDADLPAARTTPDLGARPPQAGGEDTGQPTVTSKVDAPPAKPPTGSGTPPAPRPPA